jgi:hypothetical protein
MSRSVRKTPIFGHAMSQSEKADKRRWHQRWRAMARTRLASSADLERYNDPDRREASSPWTMAKDGKSYWHPRLRPAAPGRPGYAERRAQFMRDLRK